MRSESLVRSIFISIMERLGVTFTPCVILERRRRDYGEKREEKDFESWGGGGGRELLMVNGEKYFFVYENISYLKTPVLGCNAVDKLSGR